MLLLLAEIPRLTLVSRIRKNNRYPPVGLTTGRHINRIGGAVDLLRVTYCEPGLSDCGLIPTSIFTTRVFLLG